MNLEIIRFVYDAIKEGWIIKIKNNSFTFIKKYKTFDKLPSFLIKHSKSKTKKLIH
jgi:hypothetical protein